MLGRRAGIGLGSHDVYANLAGGLVVAEPGLDLPLALALASSLRDRPIAPDTVAIGEVGLLGELRGVVGLERRLREAARLGFAAGDRAAARPTAAPLACPWTGSTWSTPRRSRRRSTPRSATGRERSWRAGPGDARLTARQVDRATRLVPGRPPRKRLIRYIRLLGAALGGLVGLALAASGDGLFNDTDVRRRPAGGVGRRLDRGRLRGPARTSPSCRRRG